MKQLFAWFTGGSHYEYLTTFDCLNGDIPWLTLTLLICFVVLIGYMTIAIGLYIRLRVLQEGFIKKASLNLVYIFFFSALCNYLFPIVKTFWPAWRLYTLLLCVLAVFAWKYVFVVLRNLKAVYQEINEAGELTSTLEQYKKDKVLAIEKVNDASVKLDLVCSELIDSIKKEDDPRFKAQLEDNKVKVASLENMLNDIRKALTPAESI